MANQISVDAILWAYRLLLGREPENLDIVNDKLTRLNNNQELVQELINSPEFVNQNKELYLNLILSLLGNALLTLSKTLNTSESSSSIMMAQFLEVANQLNQDKKNLTTIKPKSMQLAPETSENIPIGSAKAFLILGDKAKKQTNWVDAAFYYQKAIEANPLVSEKVHLELKSFQEKIGQEERAKLTYKKWIEREYLIEHKSKVIYCPIAKNACTLLKHTLLQLSDEKDDYHNSQLKMHEYIDQNREKFILRDFAYLHRPDYFKFIVIRNPFKRLVSTYADKFVKRYQKQDPHAIPVIQSVYSSLGLEPDFKTSITFSQFIDYLLQTEDYALDPHWRSQSIYFASGLFEFDFVGQFEKIDVVIKKLEQQLGISMDIDISKHRINYGYSNTQDQFHDKYPKELGKLKAFPQSSQFYTPELEEKVRLKYAEDIAIYEENFNTTISSCLD